MANGLFGGGNGTQASPYLIEDLLDLNAIRNYLNGGNYFQVTNDIDASPTELKKYGILNPNFYWNPIPIFNGFLDFNFKKLKNLYLKSCGANHSVFIDDFNSGCLKNMYLDGYTSEHNNFIRVYRADELTGVFLENCNFKGSGNGGFIGLLTSEYLKISNISAKKCYFKGGTSGFGPCTSLLGEYIASYPKDVYIKNVIISDCEFIGNVSALMHIQNQEMSFNINLENYYISGCKLSGNVFSLGVTHETMDYKPTYESSPAVLSTYENCFEYGNSAFIVGGRDGYFDIQDLKYEKAIDPNTFNCFNGTGMEDSLENAIEHLVSIGYPFPSELKTSTGKDGVSLTYEDSTSAIAYALDFNNWWIIDEGLSTPYKPSFYVKEVGSTFPQASKILTGKDGEDITIEAALKEISYALDFNNWWITDSDTKTPYKPSFYVKEVGSCVPLPNKSLTGKDGLDISESDACKKATYAFDWNNTPFIIEDGLSSPSMNYFSGGVVIEIRSGKFSKPFETGIKASVFETIVYTTDGTDPSKTSKVLSNGDKVNISESCVLKARTFDSVFVGGQYYDFLSEISKETYIISFKSVFEELMNKVKFEPHSEVDSYIDKDSDGNRMVRIIKNVDQILTVYRNEEEISEYFCDEEMVDYDFDDSEELVYYFYKEDGEFLCKSIPSEIASNKDVNGEVISEVSDMFLELYNSYEDLTVLKDYIKGYKNIYEFINSVVKLKKIKECIDEDLPKLDNLIEVKSSLESRINKFSKMKNIVQGSFYVNLEEIPEMVNHSENILVNIGVDTSNG